MHLDLWKAVAGALVGFTVGLTGMGGGALMTPILVLFFSVNPGTAVSSDLLTSLVMKPVGGAVHFRRGTVDWGLVRWLALGSMPAAFAGVFVLRQLGHGPQVQHNIQVLLGWALVVAAISMVAKAFLAARPPRTDADGVGPVALAPSGSPSTPPGPAGAVQVRRVATLMIGIAGGFIVGMTSVGSGSLMIVLLLLLYPRLSAKELVGTDIVQAIPLVGAATLSHALFGHVDAGLTGSLLVGSLPGVYVGARVSSRAPDSVIRPALVIILLGSALKLLGLGTEPTLWAMLAVVLIAAPVWGASDAARYTDEQWVAAHKRRSTWVTAQSVGAPFGVGFVITLLYLFRTRPSLLAAANRSGAFRGSASSVASSPLPVR